MADNDVRITNNSNSKLINMRAVLPFKNKKAQPSIVIPFVNQPPANTFLFRFFGQDQEISFDFVLFDDDTDVSNGTASSEIKTVTQQIQFLMDDIFTHEFDTTWELSQSVHFSPAPTGVIENIEITSQNPSFATGTLTFRRGSLTGFF